MLTDVTERRLVEQRFRLILDSAHEAFVGMDAAGVIIDWNQQAEATFGWARAEAVGRPLDETIIPPRHREAHRNGLQHFLVSGEGPLLHRRIEVAALHRDGREFPVELTITPVPLGGTHLFSAFVHDISERKRSEEALARERNLLRALMDHLPDHIFVKDTRSRFVTANAATVHTLGAKTLEEVLGKTDFDFLPQERAQQFHADEQTVLRTGQPLFNREELLIDASGQRKWLLTTKAPFRDGAGAVVGLVGMSHDVTENKEAEEERPGCWSGSERRGPRPRRRFRRATSPSRRCGPARSSTGPWPRPSRRSSGRPIPTARSITPTTAGPNTPA